MNGAMSSSDLVEYGCCWIKGHPKQFKTLMFLVHREVNRDNPCVQRGDIYQLARKQGMSVSDVNELRRDNSLWSVLTRYMVMLRPFLTRALRFRRCGIDDVDLVEKWHRYVNPNTYFFANGWREAVMFEEQKDASAQQPSRRPKRRRCS